MSKLKPDQSFSGKAKKAPQILAALAACIGAFGCGTALAWSAPSIPYLQDDLCLPDKCDIQDITMSQASWIGALMPIGAVVAGPITGYLLHVIGGRWTMISYSVPFLVGTLMYVIAYEVENVIPIYVGRFLTGFSGGAFALLAPHYIVEIAEPSMRGALTSLMQFMLTLGIAFINGLNINDMVHWNIISAVCVFIPVTLVVSMFFMPESPAFLVSKGKLKQALKSLKWLRGPEYDSLKELEKLQGEHAAQKEAGSISLQELLTVPVYTKPFVIVMGLMFLQQFSGINAVVFYVQSIFMDAGSELDPGLCSFLVTFSQVLSNGAAVFLVERFGRRILLITSEFFMSISIMGLGVFFYLKENAQITCPEFSEVCIPHEGQFSQDLLDSLGWLPLLSLTIYVVAFSIGIGPMPWTVNAEIFSAESRSLSTSITFCFNWFCAFIVTKFEANIEEGIGASGAYFLFASICAMGTVFVWACLPETKGKSPEEIKKIFQNN